MKTIAKRCKPEEDWVRTTILFQYGVHVNQQVQRFRRAESEKAGHDIGTHRAMVNWTLARCQIKE